VPYDDDWEPDEADMVRPSDPSGHALDRRTRDVDGSAGPHAKRACNDLRERGQPSFTERRAPAEQKTAGRE